MMIDSIVMWAQYHSRELFWAGFVVGVVIGVILRTISSKPKTNPN